MKAPLRFSPKVRLLEKTDIFEVTSEAHSPAGGFEGGKAIASEEMKKVVIPTPDVILADVSFVSLRPILEHAKKWLAGPETEFLVMLKPQFEASDSQLNRGVVKNEKMRREIIAKFEDWLKHNGFFIKHKKDNDLAGKKGNVERFYWLTIVGRNERKSRHN